MVIVLVIAVAAGVSGFTNASSNPSAQRVPASRDEALAMVRQIGAAIDGNGRDDMSLAADRKALVNASTAMDRLLGEFDDAIARAATGFAAIQTVVDRPSAENACQAVMSTAAEAARLTDEINASRRATTSLTFETTMPASACTVRDAVGLRASATRLLDAKAKLLTDVTDWAAASRAEDQARRTVMTYLDTLEALDAMDDIGDRLTTLVKRADDDRANYEWWTMMRAPEIAAVRRTATGFGVEREVSELEAKLATESKEFGKLKLVWKAPGFGDRLTGVATARADAKTKRASLKAVAGRFECSLPAQSRKTDLSVFAAELAGAIYQIDQAGRTWLAAADRCEKKKGFIEHVGLETTFAKLQAGETQSRPRFLQTSATGLSDPTDVSARAEWTGVPTPFTPTAAETNLIFFVTATIEGRASTMTIYVEPSRAIRR